MNRFKLTPERDFLLVDIVELQMITPSGLRLVREPKPQQQPGMAIGKVLAAGPGYTNENGVSIDVKFVPGDHVVFPASAGCLVDITGEDGIPVSALLVSTRNVYASVEVESEADPLTHQNADVPIYGTAPY